MKLSFECTIDPRSMPTVNGKKFCDSCRKNVVDLRRKSDEKIASFFEANVNPCVIIYQDQLDKLPKKVLHKTDNKFRYLPYAAGFIAVSLLPSVTLAQTEILPNAQTIGIKPVTLPALANEELITEDHTNESKVIDTKKYVLNGRVSIRDKKLKIKAGKDILIYQYNNETSERDTLAVGKLGANGKFKIELTKEQFDQLSLSKDNLSIDTETFRLERIKEMTFTDHKANILISVSAKKRRMIVGRYASVNF